MVSPVLPLLALIFGATGAIGQNATTSNLDFGPVIFGGYNNYVYRDNVTSAQVVISQYV